MLRYVLLGGALSAIVTGTILSAPSDASPICVWADFRDPVVTSVGPICVQYPLETVCSHQTFAFGTVLDTDVHACVPAPLAKPVP